MRHRIALAATLGVVVALLGSASAALASPTEEAEFVALINQSRAEAGLAPLTSYEDLADDARRHTADMIDAGTIFHSTSAQLSSYTTGWSLLGENVGMGPNPSLLHVAFMNSPTHRSNILGPYDRVGVGAERSPNGTLFVTVLFMQTSGAAPATTTTTAPPTTTTTAPPATTTTTTAAPATTTTTVPATTTTTHTPATTTTTTTGSAEDTASTGATRVVGLERARSRSSALTASGREIGRPSRSLVERSVNARSARSIPWIDNAPDGVGWWLEILVLPGAVLAIE